MFKDTFFELLEKTPINRISIKQLCEEADLNRSTFYLHYDTLEDFIREVEEEMIESHLSVLGKVYKNDITIPYIEEMLKEIKNRPYIYRNLLSDNHVRNVYISKMVRSFPDIISTEDTLFENEFARRYVVAGSMAIAEKWIDSDFAMPISQLARLLYRLNHGNAFYNPL